MDVALPCTQYNTLQLFTITLFILYKIMHIRVSSTSYLFIILFIFFTIIIVYCNITVLVIQKFPLFPPSGHKERSHSLCLLIRPCIPDLLPVPSVSLFILLHWIASFTAIIITMATRGRHPTRKGIMGRNRLLSQLTCTIWLVLCQGLYVQKSCCFCKCGTQTAHEDRLLL